MRTSIRFNDASTDGDAATAVMGLVRACGGGRIKVQVDEGGRIGMRSLAGAAYRRMRAVYPAFYAVRYWKTRRPETFNQKVRYKMLRDRRPLLTTFADKVGVREYVRDRIGGEYLPDHHQVVGDPDEIDWDSLPHEYAFKLSHGSGGTIVVWRGADPVARLSDSLSGTWSNAVIRPGHVDPKEMSSHAAALLAQVYGWGIRSQYEWAYRHVPPRLIVEELLTDREHRLPRDYRFFVFRGIPAAVQVETDWLSKSRRRDFFTPAWQRIDVTSLYPASKSPPEPPHDLDRMLAIASRLGEDTDFVRVDLYDVDGRIVFGELTNYPVNGSARFEPPTFDAWLGAQWTLPTSYRELPQGRVRE